MSEHSKESWLQLAASHELANRQLALELAAEMRADIQQELVFWFHANSDYAVREQIMTLLDAKHRELALRVGAAAGIQPLGRTDNFRLYEVASEPALREVVLMMEAESMDVRQFKMVFYRHYCALTGSTMKDAREALSSLLKLAGNS